MQILKQLLIIFLLCLIGEGISLILPFPFPASVISLILLFILLSADIIKTEQIRDISDFLLNNMAFFFIPAGVSIMEKYSFIGSSIVPILAITLITTILTFAAAGYTVSFLIKFLNRQEEKHHE